MFAFAIFIIGIILAAFIGIIFLYSYQNIASFMFTQGMNLTGEGGLAYTRMWNVTSSWVLLVFPALIIWLVINLMRRGSGEY